MNRHETTLWRGKQALLLEVDQPKGVDPPGVDHPHSAHNLRGLSAKNPACNGQGIYANIQEGTTTHGRVIDALSVLRHFCNEVSVEVVHLSDCATLYEPPYPAPTTALTHLRNAKMVSRWQMIFTWYLLQPSCNLHSWSHAYCMITTISCLQAAI